MKCKFSEEELDKLIYAFSILFDYEYVIDKISTKSGKGVSVFYYNSPVRRSFEFEIIFDENIEIEDVAETIIKEYQHR